MNFSCISETHPSTISIGEIISETDEEFFEELPPTFPLKAVLSNSEHFPGLGWYLGRIAASINRYDLAMPLFEAQYSIGDPTYFYLSLEQLLGIYLRLRRYDEIINITDDLLRKKPIDPQTEAWVYTHRFESFIQLNMTDQALIELTELIHENKRLFHSADLSHELLYYRARIAAWSAHPEELDTHVLPYVLVSSARHGHEEIYKILNDRFAETAWFYEAYGWLKVKTLYMGGEYKESFDLAFKLLEDSTREVFELAAYRPEGGIFLDLFNAASAIDPQEGSSPFDIIGNTMSVHTKNDELLQARLFEYSGRLLIDQASYWEAAEYLERAFSIVENLWNLESKTANESTLLQSARVDQEKFEMRVTLSYRREQLLWRWALSLMHIHSLDGTIAIGKVLARVRSPDFFRDITDEYIQELIFSGKWKVLHNFLQVASDSIPEHLAIPSWSILKILGETDTQTDDITAQLNTYELPASLLNQTLLSSELTLNMNTLDELFLQEFFIPYKFSGLRAPDHYEASSFSRILEGFIHLALYRDAARYLINLPAGYVVDPAVIIETVYMAYAVADWYGGLSLLEAAIRRSYRYQDGPQEFVSAAGGIDELFALLYPEAWIRQVRAPAAEYNINPYLFLAVMREESRFNPSAGSSAGALGLGQIIPETADDIARRIKLDTYDLFDPKDNVMMALYYLSYLNSRFSTIWEILAAYNAGQGRVDRWNRTLLFERAPGFILLSYVPFAETRTYLRNVINSFMTYEYLYSQRPFNQAFTESNGINIEEIPFQPIIPYQRIGN